MGFAAGWHIVFLSAGFSVPHCLHLQIYPFDSLSACGNVTGGAFKEVSAIQQELGPDTVGISSSRAVAPMLAILNYS